MRNAIAVAIVGLAIAGGSALLVIGLPVTHDVPYYMAHQSELLAELAWCRDNPGRATTDDCSAAFMASVRLTAQNMK